MLHRFEAPVLYGVVGLSTSDGKCLESSMSSFEDYMRCAYGWTGTLVARAPSWLTDVIETASAHSAEMTLGDIEGRFCTSLVQSCGACPLVLVACKPDHLLERAARKEFEGTERAKFEGTERAKPEWGATKGYLAVVYHLREYVVWHEALHLLDAEDCYDETGRAVSECDDPDCLMRFGTTKKTCLCSPNRKRIEKTLRCIGNRGLGNEEEF